MKKYLLSLLIALSVLTFALPVSGVPMTDIVLEVPVRVTHASTDVGAVVASCNVEFGSGIDAMGMPGKVNLNASGNLNHIFNVTVAFESSRLSDVKGYRCSLVLYRSGTGGLLAGGSMIETQSGIPLDPTATQVFVVSGSL